MIQTKHCDLCQHVKRSLKKGFICGLTNKKPIFESTCPDIKFNNESIENFTELLSDIEVLKSNKKSVYFNFCTLIGIGFLIIFRAKTLLTNALEIESVYHFKITLLIYGLGSLLLSIAYRNLSYYRKKTKRLESEKNKIKKVFDKYEIDMETIIKLSDN